MADGFADEAAVLAVLAAVGAALWYVLRGGFGRAEAALEAAEKRGESIFERVQEVSQNGELVIDPVSGVFYDDPEQGSLDDEAGDDRNVSFAAANDLLEDVGTYIDPTTYAPDVQDDAVAPDSGVLADAGESQNFGDAPEAENDDLTERAAESNLSDDRKAMYDRLANVDDVERLDNDNDDPAETSTSSSSSSSSTSSSGSTSSYSSGSSGFTSGSSSSDPVSSSDDDDPLSAFSQWTDDDDVDGDPATGGLVA